MDERTPRAREHKRNATAGRCVGRPRSRSRSRSVSAKNPDGDGQGRLLSDGLPLVESRCVFVGEKVCMANGPM
jgi:hypothetical protein